MSSKQDMYPQTQNLPGAPPEYQTATAPGYPAQQPQVVLMKAGVRPQMGPQPCMSTCPSCHGTYMSKINYEASSKTHLIAVLMGVFCCCCCIPYCVDSCKSANHYCSHCGAYLGSYNN